MAELKTYRVLRPLEGDRPYQVGDTRELTELDARHLVPHALELVTEDEPAKPEAAPAKAAAVLPNKAERTLKNKAAGK